MFLWCPIFDVWLNLKHPESIHESCTGQSTGQQVLHGNFFPSAGLFHAGFVACTLDIKSPLPLYSQQMNNPADFFFTRDITSCPSRPFPFWMRWCRNTGFRSHWRKQEKKISLQRKERIILLICICNSSSSILVKDFEHHHSSQFWLPLLAKDEVCRGSWQHLLTTKHNWNELICFNWYGNTTYMCISNINIMKTKYFK